MRAGLASSLLCLAFAAGCDDRGTSPPDVRAPPPAAVDFRVDLRLRGAGAGGYRAVWFETREVAVTAGDRALYVEPGDTGIDLTTAGHDWLLGSFDVPVGAGPLHVVARLDDFGTFLGSTSLQGTVDARGALLELAAPVTWLRERGVATFVVDVQRSLATPATDPSRRVLLPQLDVRY